VDLPGVAQAVPGNTIRFEQVTLEMAHDLYRERQRHLQKIRKHLHEEGAAD
jgi:allophanate hydrolase subunit 2